jgi:hypothetical protein
MLLPHQHMEYDGCDAVAFRRPFLPKILTVLLLAAAAGVGAAQPSLAAIAPHAVIAPDAMAPMITRTACGGGIWAIHTTPARGFNPLTATVAELNANNYPLPPAKTNARAYARWKKFVVTPKALASTCPSTHRTNRSSGGLPATVVRPDGETSTASSTNWAGYVAHGTTFTEAEAQWVVPAVSGVANTNDYSSSWVGVGLGQSSFNELMQAGTEGDYYGAYGTTNYYLWYELYPYEDQVVFNTTIHPLDIVGTHITYYTDGPDFHVWDDTTGFNTDFQVSGYWGDDGHAEWIYERTRINGLLPYLADAAPGFDYAQAVSDVTGKWVSLAAASDVAMSMTDCSGNPMAYPGPISGETFSAVYQHHGDQNVC